jgi:hypothetical protein
MTFNVMGVALRPPTYVEHILQHMIDVLNHFSVSEADMWTDDITAGTMREFVKRWSNNVQRRGSRR